MHWCVKLFVRFIDRLTLTFCPGHLLPIYVLCIQFAGSRSVGWNCLYTYCVPTGNQHETEPPGESSSHWQDLLVSSGFAMTHVVCPFSPVKQPF